MSRFDEDEIVEGAQPYLNESTLRASGRCKTNARIVDGYDTSEAKDRPYQIVSVSKENKTCIAAPVITAENPGPLHIKLENEEKHNFPRMAKNTQHYLFEEQACEIPFDVLTEATAGEKSERDGRRAYAPGKDDVHSAIRSRFRRGEDPFGPMRALTSLTSKEQND